MLLLSVIKWFITKISCFHFNRDLSLPDLVEEVQMAEEPVLADIEGGDDDGSGRYVRQMLVENIFSA